MYLCFLVRLHFSMGRYHCCGVTGSSKCFQFAWSLCPFWSACASMLRSRSRVLALLAFPKRRRHYPGFGRRAYLCPPFWAKRHPSPGPCFSAGASLLFWGFRLAFFPRFLEPTEFAPIFAWLLAMDPCCPEFLRRVTGPLENLIVWFDPNFPTSPQNRLFLIVILGHT